MAHLCRTLTRRPRAALSSLIALALAGAAAHAGSNRTYLAEQYTWSGNRGFSLSLENDTPDGTPHTLAGLVLALGVADGKAWNFVIHKPAGGWVLDHEYAVEAHIGPRGSSLTVDGALAGSFATGYAPYDAPLAANDQPAWASEPAQYLIAQTAFQITGGGDSLDLPFSQEGNRPLPAMLFSPSLPRSAGWAARPGDTEVLRVRFRLVATGDPRAFDPYIDAYGQMRYASWPGKITSDAGLAAAATDEEARNAAWGLPTGVDAYGGSTTAPFHEAGTGYFRLTRRDGYWWLLSPLGNPLFYTGVCTAPGLTWEMTPVTDRRNLFTELPPRSGDTGVLWADNCWSENQGTEYVAMHGVSKIRKYGADWQAKANQSAIQRMRTWGFSGFGKWSQRLGLPWFPYLSRAGVPNLVRHPDVFDPNVRAQFRTVLQNQIAPYRTDPTVVGWTVGSEYDEIVTADETRAILQEPASVPAKRALVDEAVDNLHGGSVAATAAAWGVPATTLDGLYACSPAPPAGDVEALRGFYARAYYAFLYQTVKSIDPNHLYFGFWIVPGWWENENDWRYCAPYCDVIGYDNYADSFADDRLARLIRETDKPVFTGEFSYPPYYGGQRGFGRLWTFAEDDADAGNRYTRWITDATANPYCVGVNWFEYRDQDITGRGPGRGPAFTYGENYAFGVIDITDTPKWDLVTRMRAANLASVGDRLQAASVHVPFERARRALRLAAGLSPLGPTDMHDLDMVTGEPSAGRIDLLDAAALAQRGL